MFVRSKILVLAALCLILFSGGEFLLRPWNINLLSLDYLSQVKALDAGGDSLPYAPADHPRASLWNAIAAIQDGNYQIAFTLLQPLVTTGDQYALEIKAWAYEAQGDYHNATQIQKHLNNPKALLRICKTSKETGDYDNAITACNAAWEIDFPIATSLFASVFIEKGDLAAAEMLLRHSLARTDDHHYRPYWLFKLATVLEKQGHWAESIKFHLQGISEQLLIGTEVKSPPRAYADLAGAYNMNGQVEDAVRTIEEAIARLERDPDLFYVWFRAGQIYESADLPMQAINAYQYCLELRLGHTTSREAIERLSSAIQK